MSSMKQKLTDLSIRILDLASAKGADACAVRLGTHTSRRVVHRDGQWEEIKGSTTLGAVVRLFVDGRYAVHRTSDLRPESLSGFLEEAVSLTRHVMPEPHRKLPEPSLYAPKNPPDPDLFDGKIMELTLESRKQRALAAFEACKQAAGEACISATASFGDSFSEQCLAHSDGFQAHSSDTSFSLFAMASVMDPGGGRPSDWESSSSRFLADLDSPEKTGKQAGERAKKAMGAQKVNTGNYELLIENRAVGNILRGLVSPLSGAAIFNKQSWAAGRQGHPVASSLLTLSDDPLIRRGLGSRICDSEGLAARPMDLYAHGVLRHFLMDTYYGSRLSMPVTTGSTSNLVVTPGTEGFPALVSRMRRGIWVNRFIGGNVNGTTGDFSMGLGGFLVENGVVVHPVIELNLSSNHTRFWQNLVALGSDVRKGSSLLSPSLLLSPILIAGK